LAEESFQNNFFDTEYLKADLKGRSVRGGAVTMAAQGTRFFLSMASTVVLARLLTPQDFGLIAMVTAVTGFVLMFKDMGLSMATVQRAEVNHGQISTLFWINVILSLGVMLVVAALAPVIAWFYGEPRLTWITLALAGAFIFGGLTVQHQALLRRQMRFGSLALIQIISMSVGILTAIISAFYGAGYWSLVLMQLATAITGAIAVWVACGWRPGLPVRRSGVREMLAFGGHITGFNIINYLHRNIDNVLLGKFFGSFILGQYSRAYALLLLPITQIRAPLISVALPGLSRLQHEPDRFRKYYVELVSILAFASMPLVVFLGVFSRDAVALILGEGWLPAARIFRILAIAAFIQPVFTTRGAVLLSLGQSKRYLNSGMIQSSVFVLALIAGVPWGAEGVATSYVFANYAILVPMFLYCFRYTPLTLRDFLMAILRPALVSIGLGLGLIAIRECISYSGVVSRFSIGFCSALVIYFALWLVIPGGKNVLKTLVGHFSVLFGG